MNLKKSGEPLILKDKNKNVIDETWKDYAWPAGSHGVILHMSMKRDSNPGDGTKSSNWSTCTDKKYKDSEEEALAEATEEKTSGEELLKTAPIEEKPAKKIEITSENGDEEVSKDKQYSASIVEIEEDEEVLSQNK